jgi:hypothetical protein
MVCAAGDAEMLKFAGEMTSTTRFDVLLMKLGLPV